MNDKVYWIWLQQVLGFGAKTDEIIATYKTAKEIYEATHEERYFSGVFTKRQLEKLQTTSLSDAENITEECLNYGYGVLTPEDEDFPQSLMQIRETPVVLYYKGDIKILQNKLKIAVVGTRNATETGLTATYRLSKSLSQAGAVIVSGGAIGIDGASHLGALDASGETVAVTGCGFNARYHDSTENLKDRILRKGLILTEFPPNTAPLGKYFPIRNRIVASLCDGLVVAECPVKSGSMITVDYAYKYKKDLFAIPGNILDVNNSGTIELIRKQCAAAIFSASDVLRFYEYTHADKINMDKINYSALYEMKDSADFSAVTKSTSFRKQAVKEIITEEKPKVDETTVLNFETNAKTVYDILLEGAMHIDEIMRKSGSMSIGQVFSAITELELNGLIASDSGRKYRRK